jgi:hypothetical protein
MAVNSRAGKESGQKGARPARKAPVVTPHEPAAALAYRQASAETPTAMRPADVLALQQAVGNRRVQRLLGQPAVQRLATEPMGPEQVQAAIRYNQGRGFPLDIVRQIQQTVGATPDGAFSESAVKAIATWQGQNSLVPDGKVGSRTMTKIAEQAASQAQTAEATATPTAESPTPAGQAGPAPGATEEPGVLDTLGGLISSGLDTISDFFFGEEEQPTTGGPVAAEPTASEPTANEPGPSQPTELETLMAKERLSIEEIQKARELIDQETDDTKRAELYQSLQAKVEYHSQRDNTSVENGEKIGDVMCNLTSLAMALSYLGVPNPNPDMQYEDALEKIRVEKKLPARTLSTGWGGVAKELGVKVEFVGYDVVEGHDWYVTNVQPHLEAGRAVMASISGHIVRLQAVTPDGLVADDPYGKVKLTKGTGHKWEETNKSANQQKAGEDSVWPWADVSIHNMRWIAWLSKG